LTVFCHLQDLTDKFTPQQRELLKLIQTKVYERNYHLTEVFKSFNKGRIPPGESTGKQPIGLTTPIPWTQMLRENHVALAGDLPAALVEEGVLRMLNMGRDNPLLVQEIREMVDICTRSDGFVSYDEFAHVFKRKDTQDDPLIEGTAVSQPLDHMARWMVAACLSQSVCFAMQGDRYLWAGKVFSRQGKQGLINDNVPIQPPDEQQEMLQRSSVGDFDYPGGSSYTISR